MKHIHAITKWVCLRNQVSVLHYFNEESFIIMFANRDLFTKSYNELRIAIKSEKNTCCSIQVWVNMTAMKQWKTRCN